MSHGHMWLSGLICCRENLCCNSWVSHGLCMCASHGHLMDFTWMSHGCSMDVTWASCDCLVWCVVRKSLLILRAIFAGWRAICAPWSSKVLATLHIVCMCASHGQLMGVAWMSYGHHVTVIFSPLHWSILRNLCRYVCKLCSHVEGLCTQVIVYFYLYRLKSSL